MHICMYVCIYSMVVWLWETFIYAYMYVCIYIYSMVVWLWETFIYAYMYVCIYIAW